MYVENVCNVNWFSIVTKPEPAPHPMFRSTPSKNVRLRPMQTCSAPAQGKMFGSGTRKKGHLQPTPPAKEKIFDSVPRKNVCLQHKINWVALAKANMFASSKRTYCCIHATKGVERKVSTMYFYKTAYRQYVHSGSDTHIHSLFFFLSSSGQASVSLTL